MKNAPVPSAAIVYTGQQGGRGDNSGAAAVLPVDNQQGAATRVAQGFAQERARLAATAKKAALEEQRKQKDAKTLFDALDAIRLNPIWDKTDEEITSKIAAQGKDLAALAAQGSDVSDPSSELSKALRKYESENELMKGRNEDAKKIYGEWVGRAADPKFAETYDADYFSQKMGELQAIKDEEGATEKIYQWVANPENNPFIERADFLEMAEDVTPEYGKDGTISKAVAEENFDLLFGQNPKKLTSLQKQGYGTDYESTKKVMVDHVLKNNPDKRIPKEGGSSGGSGSTSSDKDTYDYALAATNGKWGKANAWDIDYEVVGDNEQLRVKKGQDDLPAIQVLDFNGVPFEFQTQYFYKDKNGKVYAYGLNKKGGAETIFYDVNKGNFKTQMDGFDVEEYFNTKKGGDESKGTPKKTETPAERLARRKAGG